MAFHCGNVMDQNSRFQTCVCNKNFPLMLFRPERERERAKPLKEAPFIDNILDI